MPIAIITTGGTIAEAVGTAGPRHLTGADLLAGFHDDGDGLPALEIEDLMDVPSTYIGPEEMLRVANAVRRQVARSDIQGVVVTHGTATVEETIYFVDLVVRADKPIVFTGAQRSPASLGYDGYRNLRDAISVASSPSVASNGVVLAFDGEIHSARDVAEVHPSGTAGFRSLDCGPIGRVDLNKVVVMRRSAPERARWDVDEPLKRVDLLTCYAGMTGDVVEAVARLGASGLVIQGMTSGAIPPGLLPAVRAAIDTGTVVVLTTRCPSGRVLRRAGVEYDGVKGYGTDLERLGVALTELPGLKARCRLIAVLSSGLDQSAARQAMDTAR